MYFHNSCLDMRMKEVRENISAGKYVDPIFKLEKNSVAQPANKSSEVEELKEEIKSIRGDIQAICDHLGITISTNSEGDDDTL